jgi:photosystem II stability/assembly factor-like uncharacterized protein
MGGHRGKLGAQQRVDRRRRLQIRRWRRKLEERWPQGFRTHRQDSDRSQGRQHRLRLRHGHLWDDNDERGVYKTSDGGKTWRKVLAGANGSTGCGMLSMAAQDPKTIYASMWDFRRQAWTFRSGGPGSGLFKSTDGGENWTELTPANAKGLPEKPYGRIALAVAPSKPQVVYATIESKSSALYRSATAARTGRAWMPANTRCGVPFISPI